MKVNWNEASTKRGLVFVITGIVAIVFLWVGKDVQLLLTVGTFVAGGLGLTLPDRKE